MPKIAIEDIDLNVKDRFRQELGDLGPLIQSIKKHGLIHPIILSEDSVLICGRRRIAACMRLGYKEVDVWYTDATDLRAVEADENIVRKAFSVEEIAEIDEFFRDREEAEAKERQKKGINLTENFGKASKSNSVTEAVGNKRESTSASKIAARVGISDRTLEKIRAIKEASTESPSAKDVWDKVASGKMKVDKGYNKIKKFQRRKADELELENMLKSHSPFEIFDLQFGDMRELGENIPDNSIGLIFTDPPYTEDSLSLYGDLAKLADRVLKPGGSLVTYAGHYAIFKINDLIRANSNLKYQWQIVVLHTGSKTRFHSRQIWPYYKPLLWYYKPDIDGKIKMYDDIGDVVESKPVSKDTHEWEQSTVEAEHIIKPLTVEGECVLDPFAGSGTTLEAASRLKRRFIGIENDETSYSRIKQRLAKLKQKNDACNVSILGKNLQVANSSYSQAVGGDVK